MKKKPSSQKPSAASKLGSTLACLQDALDQLVGFGFKKLKESGSKKVTKNDSELKKAVTKAAGFLGETGTAFYEKYEEIKEKRRTKNKA